MRCAWKELLAVLPPRMRADVDRLGRETLQEIRLRLNKNVQLLCSRQVYKLDCKATNEDMTFVINASSKYSPWSAATASQGYITAAGGHRIGLCGIAVVSSGQMTGIRCPTSLCIRVAREFPGIAAGMERLDGNILIVGPPGSGKTTLLRDLIRRISQKEQGSIAVIDERFELFPPGMDSGDNTDVLQGCSKVSGVQAALRTMGPTCIAVDEITAQDDCRAITEAVWCGVRVIATAHAANRQDLLQRSIYRPLMEGGLFEQLILLQRDKSYRTERICK